MSTQEGPRNPTDDLPEAAVEEKSGFSLVWLVPLIAALIGGWLVYKALSEKGPTITLSFLTAEGIEAGKTKIKFKDVEVGEVTSVDISPDLERVMLTAELEPGTRPYLTDKSRFWVVRARVAAGKVSGLGTLFSGAYIAIDPDSSGRPTRHFVGLEEPPAVTSYEHGRQFTLRADRLGSLDTGAPVYYHQVKVGEVTGYNLEKNGRGLTVDLFIYDPYPKFVRENSRFWNASGLDFSLTAAGLEVDTQSLVSVILGGVAFNTPDTAGTPARAGRTFRLYRNREDAQSPTYTEKVRYRVIFKDSANGLVIGAPVQLMGIKIGEVKDIRLEGNLDTFEVRIPVLIEVEPQRIRLSGKTELDQRQRLEVLVRHGLRAQLETGNLLTGQKYVSLAFHPEATPAEVVQEGPYLVIPSIPTPLGELKASLNELLKKLSRVPMDEIGRELSGTLAGLNQTVNSQQLRSAIADLSATLNETRKLTESLTAQSLPSLNKTLAEVEQTAGSARDLLSTGSPLYTEMLRTLRQLSEAARSMRIMADYLQRHPEALISGKGARR